MLQNHKEGWKTAPSPNRVKKETFGTSHYPLPKLIPTFSVERPIIIEHRLDKFQSQQEELVHYDHFYCIHNLQSNYPNYHFLTKQVNLTNYVLFRKKSIGKFY